MSDAFDSYQDRIASYRDKLKYVENASGFAVAIGDRVAAMDYFDKPSTCRLVWDRMLSGVVFDALEAGETRQFATVADVQRLITAAANLSWNQFETVGEGEEYRAESETGDHASALALEHTVVHGSMLAAV